MWRAGRGAWCPFTYTLAYVLAHFARGGHGAQQRIELLHVGLGHTYREGGVVEHTLEGHVHTVHDDDRDAAVPHLPYTAWWQWS